MIINFKIFENINKGEPEIGDYVICMEYDIDGATPDKLLNFLSNNIGKYIGVGDIECPYEIKYLNPKDLIEYFNYEGKSGRRLYSRDEILYWSKYKKNLMRFLPLDIDQILLNRKFNL